VGSRLLAMKPTCVPHALTKARWNATIKPRNMQCFNVFCRFAMRICSTIKVTKWCYVDLMVIAARYLSNWERINKESKSLSALASTSETAS
jgi:hypothetical protein